MSTHPKRAALLLAIGLALSACGSGDQTTTSDIELPPTTTSSAETTETVIESVEATEESGDVAAQATGPGLTLIGTSGNEIVVNQLWVQGCIPGQDGIDWQDSRRVLVVDGESFQLVTTLTDFQNGSAEPDCENGRVASSTFSQSVVSLDEQVDFDWVDFAGAPADAPAGMEEVTVGNGMEGLMVEASVTPEVQGRADELNAAEFCGVSDWEAGVPQDTLICFNGGEPQVGRTLLVIDDSDFPWANYQASNFGAYNEDGFAIDVTNSLPFLGPFLP